MQASDRFNINSQLEHLQAKYVGTGHADLNRYVIATLRTLAIIRFSHTLLLPRMSPLGENATTLCRKCFCLVVLPQKEKAIENVIRSAYPVCWK